jgi:DNA invertase Pin-like site-specific DNA recombinase
MLKLLRQRKAEGVVMHKIDRSARNLKDWADLVDLADRGIEVQFANEGLDLNSRGGRLSADIQAVVASDYIRNLREEAKKGIYGRLKQGFHRDLDRTDIFRNALRACLNSEAERGATTTATTSATSATTA